MSLIKLPEGVEAAILVYIVDDAGHQARVQVRGLTNFPTEFDINAEALAKSVGFDLKMPTGNVWRVMTRAEIKEYKADNPEE